jgi:hypothetical protein
MCFIWVDPHVTVLYLMLINTSSQSFYKQLFTDILTDFFVWCYSVELVVQKIAGVQRAVMLYNLCMEKRNTSSSTTFPAYTVHSSEARSIRFRNSDPASQKSSRSATLIEAFSGSMRLSQSPSFHNELYYKS